MNETIHVLLTYCDDDDETYCHLFRTKEAVLEYLRDIIRGWYDEECRTPDYPDWKKDMDKELAEMEKAMNENGYWRDGGDEITYVYSEKEFTA